MKTIRGELLVLPACFVSACAAQQTTYDDTPLSVVEVQLEEVKQVKRTETDQQTAIKPAPDPLPVISEEKYVDEFMRVASCYDFRMKQIDGEALPHKLEYTVYNPCLSEGFQRVMDGEPEVQVAARTRSVTAVRPGVFLVRPGLTLELTPPDQWRPMLCAEPQAVGGTLPSAPLCRYLDYQVEAHLYLLSGFDAWYFLLQEKDDEQENP